MREQTLPDGRVIGYTYDANGNVKTITPPGRPEHKFSYTPVDLTASYTPPAVAGTGPTTYTYNLDRQLTGITRLDSSSVNLGYDSAGRLKTLTTPRGTTTYDYYPITGNLATVKVPGGTTLGYRYDGVLLTQVAWSGPVIGTVDYRYDNDFRVSSTSINDSNTITFQHDDDGLLAVAGDLTLNRNGQNGLLTGSTLGVVTDTIGYNGFGEPESYNASAGGTELYGVEYTRDKQGRIAQQVETIGGATTTYDYGYDRAGRLKELKQNGAVVATYTYDSNGNRLTAPGVTTAIYDDQDRLLTYGATAYTYTANGELRSKTTGDDLRL
jgi:YD repeat-containing protein